MWAYRVLSNLQHILNRRWMARERIFIKINSTTITERSLGTITTVFSFFLPSNSFSGQNMCVWRLPWWLSGKEPACQCRRHRFNPWVRKMPWRRKWQPTPVFLPGKCHGERSLAGYSPWGHKESDTTKQLSTYIYVWTVPDMTTKYRKKNQWKGESILWIELCPPQTHILKS